MEWLCKRLLMFAAHIGDWYQINRLEHWAYDQVIVHGWEGLDTFIRLELDLDTPSVPLPGEIPAADQHES